MCKKFLTTLLTILLICVQISAQTSANISLTATSGTDAYFSFTNINELETGKTLPYSTVLKLEYVGDKLPGKFKLYGKTVSETFDGPSTDFKTSNLSVKVTGIKSETVTESNYGNDNENAEIMTEKKLSSTENTLLLILTISQEAQDLETKYNSFYITLQFSLKPEEGETLAEYQPGYYTNYACFFVETSD